MYLRVQEPQKLVGLVKDMLRQDYFVSDGLMNWVEQLKAGDHAREAERMSIAESKMSLSRQISSIGRRIGEQWSEKIVQKQGRKWGSREKNSRGRTESQ